MKQLLIFFFMLTVKSFGLNHSNTALKNDTTIHIRTKDYEGVIFSQSYKPSFYLGEELLENRFTPNREEVAEAERELVLQLNETLQKDQKVYGFKDNMNVKKFLRGRKRQYLGYISNKGQKMVFIQLLNFKHTIITPSPFRGWQEGIIVGFGAFYERHLNRYQYNLTSKQLSL
jgi:hypothetical protein